MSIASDARLKEVCEEVRLLKLRVRELELKVEATAYVIANPAVGKPRKTLTVDDIKPPRMEHL